jgi:hypothetical protein
MTYVLILFVVFGYGTAITTQEFNSREACESAAEAAMAMHKLVRTKCVEKG